MVALKIDKKVYGDKHPRIAGTLNNLSLSWGSLGEYKKAIDYCEKSLGILEIKLGTRHFLTINARKNLESLRKKFISNDSPHKS